MTGTGSDLARVLLPARILDRHVGGNTTYARRLADGLVGHGLAVGRIPAGRHPALTLARETLEGMSRHGAGTVLHFTSDTGPLVRTRTPSVVTIHGVASRWVTGVRTTTGELVWRRRVSRAATSVSHVITDSASSARDVAEVFGVPPERISTIPLGVQMPVAAPPGELSPGVSAVLPEHFVLYLGNIEPRKNVLALVRAFETERIRATGLHLVVAGRNAWGAQDAMAAIAASDRVVPLGFVSEPDRVELLRRCVLFVFPSLYEGFGLPVLEAMAAGVPVLTSDRGSLAEVAGPAKVLASLDVDGIADGVLDAVGDDRWRADVATEGPRWARTFTWEACVARHVDVYRKVLAA